MSFKQARASIQPPKDKPYGNWPNYTMQQLHKGYSYIQLIETGTLAWKTPTVELVTSFDGSPLKTGNQLLEMERQIQAMYQGDGREILSRVFNSVIKYGYGQLSSFISRQFLSKVDTATTWSTSVAMLGNYLEVVGSSCDIASVDNGWHLFNRGQGICNLVGTVVCIVDPLMHHLDNKDFDVLLNNYAREPKYRYWIDVATSPWVVKVGKYDTDICEDVITHSWKSLPEMIRDQEDVDAMEALARIGCSQE